MDGLSSMLCRGLTAIIVATLITTSLVTPVDACATDPYLGQICVFAFNFCPRGWAAADGATLSISQNTALFSLLGTTYGGNGQTTFALPDLRGRVMRGIGQGFGLASVDLGEASGEESVFLTVSQMPAHNHSLRATSTVGDAPGPNKKLLSRVNPNDGSIKPYNHAMAASPDGTMAAASIGATGGGQPVDIRPPSLGLTACIAVQGVFPARN